MKKATSELLKQCHKCDIKHKNSKGKTALAFALENGWQDISVEIMDKTKLLDTLVA